ncbi:MAG TPA: ABC transporter family substrate-binding protein [Acidimicrobiales bacterium]|nr:ABC transporter family substrate-binding protein [Acidimicrobiales bacterium]
MTPGPRGRRGAAGAALLIAVVGAGCVTTKDQGLPPAGKSATTAMPLVAQDGGSATLAVDSVPTTLNDHTVAGDDAVTRAVCSLVWPQVFQVGPGMAPVLDTTVMQSAEVVSVNPQTVVYQIDPKATWSDGTPVTAQDFVYQWLSQSGPGRDIDGTPDSVAAPAGYGDIASVTGSNNGKTVTVVFQTPFADWASLFDDLLPAHVAERVGWNTGFDRFDPASLVSAGPFVVKSWAPGVELTLGRNPHWWGTPARLDQVVLRAVTGAPAMAAALRAGAATVVYPGAFDATFEAQVSSSPILQSATNLGTTMLQLVFNTRRDPVDVPSVRQGIAHLIDRASLVTSQVQPLDPIVWEDNNHLFANAGPWYADDASGYVEPDPVNGTRLLGAGGFVLDSHGIWTAKGAPVALQLVWAADDPWSALVAPALAAQLVSAGFTVTSLPTTVAQLEGSVLPKGAFDLALAPQETSIYPSTLAASFGVPQGAPAAAVRDWSGYDDPKLDALFAQASAQLAVDQERGLYQQIDSALWSAMPTLPLFAEPTALAWSASLTGVHDDPGGLGPLWSATRWALLAPAPPRSHAARHGTVG